jgi:hypothetical protein
MSNRQLVMTMIRKAEDSVSARQADPTPAINKGMIVSTVKKNSILQHHTYYLHETLAA